MSASQAATATGGHELWHAVLQLSAQEVFGLMLNSALEVPREPPTEQRLEITAMVGLTGQICGVVSTRCTSKAAIRMASLMLGIDAAQAGAHMRDAVGEICNMVAGNFKNKISGLGDGCMLSVPTVVTGTNYTLHTMVNEEIRVVLLFEGEPLVVGLEVHH